jgi:hypothetical protein
LTGVRPIIEGAIDAVRESAESKRIAIDAQINPRLAPVSVDPNRLHQIVWHLVSNAVKFTPAGGHVSISVESADDDLRIVVRDTGIGFQPEAALQLFEQFRQGDTGTTRQYGGLGLGLAIARHLVEQHGGTIASRSDGPDQGAEFEVRLPMRAGAATAPDQATPVEPAPLLRGLSILVVDDNPDDREFVRTSLEHYGAVVRTAASTQEACEQPFAGSAAVRHAPAAAGPIPQSLPVSDAQNRILKPTHARTVCRSDGRAAVAAGTGR